MIKLLRNSKTSECSNPSTGTLAKRAGPHATSPISKDSLIHNQEETRPASAKISQSMKPISVPTRVKTAPAQVMSHSVGSTMPAKLLTSKVMLTA